MKDENLRKTGMVQVLKYSTRHLPYQEIMEIVSV